MKLREKGKGVERFTYSICGQLRSCVPGKVVQLSPALAKLTEVGFLMEVKKASGIMLKGVSVRVIKL